MDIQKIKDLQDTLKQLRQVIALEEALDKHQRAEGFRAAMRPPVTITFNGNCYSFDAYSLSSMVESSKNVLVGALKNRGVEL